MDNIPTNEAKKLNVSKGSKFDSKNSVKLATKDAVGMVYSKVSGRSVAVDLHFLSILHCMVRYGNY